MTHIHTQTHMGVVYTGSHIYRKWIRWLECETQQRQSKQTHTHTHTNLSPEKGTKSRTDLQRISPLSSLSGSSSYRTPLTHTHTHTHTNVESYTTQTHTLTYGPCTTGQSTAKISLAHILYTHLTQEVKAHWRTGLERRLALNGITEDRKRERRGRKKGDDRIMKKWGSNTHTFDSDMTFLSLHITMILPSIGRVPFHPLMA